MDRESLQKDGIRQMGAALEPKSRRQLSHQTPVRSQSHRQGQEWKIVGQAKPMGDVRDASKSSV